MIKIPFEIVNVEVDKLYPPHYNLKPGETIEDHMMYIEDFIESCGWSIEEYLQEYISRSFGDTSSSIKHMN